MRLGREDAGKTKNVSVGDHLVVVLAEQPTTGYRWRAEFDPGVLRPVGDHYEGPTTPVGAGGTRTFTFEVIASQRTTLRFLEGRSWESSVTDEFTVEVGPA